MARAKAIESESYTYTVVFEPDAEAGGYVVTCPALPGLDTGGDRREGVPVMTADAIGCYPESLRRDGLPLPLGEGAETEPAWKAITVVRERA